MTDVKERTEAAAGTCPVHRFPLNQPDGHKAPVPRYSAAVAAKVAVLFLGLQTKAETLPDAGLSEFLARVAKASAAPVYIDQATYTDLQGYVNRVAALYWLDIAQFRTWLKAPAVKDWRARMRGETSVGLWWEPVVVDARRMETITFKEFRRGFSGCPAMGLQSTDHTGYWGAARDRIPGAADDRFEATVSTSGSCPITGASYRQVQPPKNMCVIRSGVSWEKCEGEQLKDWRERIKPKLDAGMTYLRENPAETGCFSLRQVESISPDGLFARRFRLDGASRNLEQGSSEPSGDLYQRIGGSEEISRETAAPYLQRDLHPRSGQPAVRIFQLPSADRPAAVRRQARREGVRRPFPGLQILRT